MSDRGPFDEDELVRWAENYGHPEGWAKKAQALHGELERLREALHQVEMLKGTNGWAEQILASRSVLVQEMAQAIHDANPVEVTDGATYGMAEAAFDALLSKLSTALEET